MTTNTSEKAFLILTIIFVLVSGNIALISAQSEKSVVSLRIEFSPPKIEQTEAEHEIGYVWFENKAENLITTLEDVSKLYHTTIPEKVKQTERNGGTVRLVVDEIPDKMKLFIKRFGASEVRIGKLPSKGRIAVSKSCPLSGKLLMSDSAVKGNLHENTDAECALFTNSDEMTNNIFTLCTFIWKGSAPVEL